METLERIEFENQREDIKEHVTEYWSKRAPSFFELRKEELSSYKADLWRDELDDALKIVGAKNLRVLDVGCGAGFFEVLLAQKQYRVTGIDLTKEMVDETMLMIKKYGLSSLANAVQMDAESLTFDDETFDLVISRNLTWTLPHPEKAYREWHRVLKKGGLLLNFDAEYAKGAHHFKDDQNIAHADISRELKDECHQIYHMLTISSLKRPEWDVPLLEKIGFTKIETDTNFGDRVYAIQDRFYMPERMFKITAIK